MNLDDLIGTDAFPTSISSGLSKQEFFAALAMQGILANNQCDWTPEVTASVAADHAEALLTELHNRKRS